MQRLSRLTDVIYVHVDMDVLDPREVPGHPLAVPDGPTSAELAAALEEMFRYPKAVAFGVASTPAGRATRTGSRVARRTRSSRAPSAGSRSDQPAQCALVQHLELYCP
jgi:arginase family enzyme